MQSSIEVGCLDCNFNTDNADQIAKFQLEGCPNCNPHNRYAYDDHTWFCTIHNKFEQRYF